MRATPHACITLCETDAIDAPSPFRPTMGDPLPPGLTHAAIPVQCRPKGKKALQKLAKDYPPSALPFRYLVRLTEPLLPADADEAPTVCVGVTRGWQPPALRQQECSNGLSACEDAQCGRQMGRRGTAVG